MPDTAIVRLSPIAPFGSDLVYVGRMRELSATMTRWSEARGRCISASAMTGLAALFTVVYGTLGSWIWLAGGPIVLAVIASVFCGGLLLATLSLADEVGKERAAMRAAAPSAELIGEVRAEAELLLAVAKFDALACGWNAALAATEEVDVGPDSMGQLVEAHVELERRRTLLADAIVRAWQAAAVAESAPKELPPPSDWGHTVRIDLKSP